MEKRILHLVLKVKWYDMIAAGEKREEYRETKPHWIKRLAYMVGHDDFDFVNILGEKFKFREFDIVRFSRGYTSVTMDVEFNGATVGVAKPQWSGNWEGYVFVIKLGNIIK